MSTVSTEEERPQHKTLHDEFEADTGTLFEPVNVAARFENPKADVDRDRSRNWFMRISPILMVNKWLLITALSLAVVGMLAGIVIPALTGRIIDALVPAVKDGATGPLYLLVGIMVGVSVLRFASQFINQFFMQRVSNQIEADLRSIIYNHLLTLSFSFYDKIQTGQVISRANSDIRAIQMFLMMTPNVLISLLSFVGAVVYMLSVSITLTFASLVALPGVYILSMKLRAIMFPLSWWTQARTADVAVIVDENINGQRVVKSFAQESHQVNLLARAAKRLQWIQVRTVDIQARYNPVIEELTAVGQVLVWFYGGWLVIQGEIALGSLVAFNMYIMMVQMPFRMLGMLLQMEQRAAASAGRIFEILDAQPEIVNRAGAVDLMEPRGRIVFRNVTFGYGDEKVLKNLSFEVEPGETVAIVGRTGSGKSTIVRLLSRFYEIQEGSVTIDGIDIRDMTDSSLHYQVGMVLDEPFLFSISIRENIAYGRPGASLEAVQRAAKAAQAHEFIMALPEGYDTVVGERGYTLSGGQRQRIGIARSLLLNPPVLVLDDATSAIDVRVEAKIHEAFLQLMRDRTTIVIAHRLSTISLADRVLLLEGGRVVASGTHRELIENEPRYAYVLAHQEERKRDAAEPAPVAGETDAEYRRRIAALAGGASPGGGMSGGDIGGMN